VGLGERDGSGGGGGRGGAHLKQTLKWPMNITSSLQACYICKSLIITAFTATTDIITKFTQHLMILTSKAWVDHIFQTFFVVCADSTSSSTIISSLGLQNRHSINFRLLQYAICLERLIRALSTSRRCSQSSRIFSLRNPHRHQKVLPPCPLVVSSIASFSLE